MNREEYIKELIKQKGMNLKDFANSINIPYSTFLSIVNGSVGGAALNTVLKICEGLNITVEELQAQEEKSPLTIKGRELSEKELIMLSLLQQIPDEKQSELLDAFESILRISGLIE